MISTLYLNGAHETSYFLTHNKCVRSLTLTDSFLSVITTYIIDNVTLHSVSHFRDLYIILNQFTLNIHMSETVKDSFKLLGFIYKNRRRDFKNVKSSQLLCYCLIKFDALFTRFILT